LDSTAVYQALQSIRLIEIVDLTVVWILVWAGIAWLRTTPARLALAGLAILGAGYLVARQVGLVLTTWILQGFAAVGALIAVVVFQQDLRRLFEQIAAVGLRRGRVVSGPDSVDTLVRALVHLAEHRRGALVVIPGHESVEGHIDGGVSLDAEISEPLLLSIFDPHSAGHDGAVICEADRVSRFAVHLPLSTDHGQLGQRGTRHAAALGLTERCDALCVVVSEERGTVSIARDAKLQTLSSPQQVSQQIHDFLRDLNPQEVSASPRFQRMLARWREALLAVPVAALLWVLAVPGATPVDLERDVPVSVSGIPDGYELDRIEPDTVRVGITGLRRDVFILAPDALGVRVDAILVELGRRSFSLTPANVRHPDTVEVRSIEPDRVKVYLRKRSQPAAPASNEDSG